MNMPAKRTVTVNGHRYTVTVCSYDPSIIDIKGPHLVGGWAQRLPFDTPDLKERIIAELARLKQASADFQEFLARSETAKT